MITENMTYITAYQNVLEVHTNHNLTLIYLHAIINY